MAGEVMIAFDHVARLKEALVAAPNDYVTFPAPAGAKGRGFMPVVAGLGIAPNAPNKAGAAAAIEQSAQAGNANCHGARTRLLPRCEGGPAR